MNDENEARALISLACPMNYEGQYVAPELAEEQTIANLERFGDRLELLYERHVRGRADAP